MFCVIIQEIIKHEPEIATALKALFAKKDATAADWDGFRAGVAAGSYAKTVTNTFLTPEELG